MKILIVGSDRIFAIENFYVKYLREMGEEVGRLSVQTLFYEYYEKSILNRVLFKLGLSSIYSTINKVFKTRVQEFKPEIIWVFKGMEIMPASLRWARSVGVKLANYNPDNPFLFSGRGSGNQNITDAIDLYDLHFTYNLEVQKKLDAGFRVRTSLLPFGFDISAGLFEECNQVEEIPGTCFLGNPDKNRAEFIYALAEKGLEISVYGHGWKKFVVHPGVKSFDAVYGRDQFKVLRKYRVQLNLMRIHNENSHNMRTFEVPGIGGIMVAPDTPQHRLFFEDGKEVFLYKGVDDCSKIIQELINVSPTKAMEIRVAARNRSINSCYSYKDRSAQALAELKCLLN